jgi:hypothetical protein
LKERSKELLPIILSGSTANVFLLLFLQKKQTFRFVVTRPAARRANLRPARPAGGLTQT